MTTRTRSTTRLWLALAALFLLPVTATAVTGGIGWDAADFLFFALILAGAGLALELAARAVPAGAPRWLAGAVIAVAAVRVWADGAGGVF